MLYFSLLHLTQDANQYLPVRFGVFVESINMELLRRALQITDGLSTLSQTLSSCHRRNTHKNALLHAFVKGAPVCQEAIDMIQNQEVNPRPT
jgi:hypothetical protein